MFWYKDATRPKRQVCFDCELFFFFFQILHKFSNYAGRWPFPRMGMIPLGGNILYWQGNLLPLYTYITEEQNLLSMQQNNMNFYNVLGFKYIGRKDWRCSGSWVWPQPCCPRMTAFDVGLPISISGKTQLTDDCLSSENHQVMNPFCAIPLLLAKDQSAVSYSSKWSFVKFPTQCLISQSYKWEQQLRKKKNISFLSTFNYQAQRKFKLYHNYVYIV